jgi:hypothetical protein
MLRQRPTRALALAGIFSLILLSCVIEEDLRINADGSGTYRVKVSIPKELSEGFGDFRKEAEKDGFRVEQEGETEKERFVVLRKDFTDVASLSDSNNQFELSTTDVGFLRREYRLSVSLQAIGFGSYKRRMVITMPAKVLSASAGEIAGTRVTWEGSRGGTIEVTSSGMHIPLSRNQKGLLLAAIAAALLLVVRSRRRQQKPLTLCASCNAPISIDTRFCGVCGAGIPITQS